MGTLRWGWSHTRVALMQRPTSGGERCGGAQLLLAANRGCAGGWPRCRIGSTLAYLSYRGRPVQGSGKCLLRALSLKM